MSENLKQEVVQDDEFNIEEVEQVIAPTVIGGGDLDKDLDGDPTEDHKLSCRWRILTFKGDDGGDGDNNISFD